MSNYLKILGEFFPTAQATNTGADPSVYSNINWITSTLAQSTLDNIAIKATWPLIEQYSVYADNPAHTVINNTATIIASGVPVYSNGTDVTTGRTLVSAANSASASTLPAIGVTMCAIPANSGGIVCMGGQLRSTVDTSTFNAGDILYVQAGGGLTNVKPTSLQSQVVGIVSEVSNPGNIYVNIQSVTPRAGQKSIDIPIYGTNASDYRSSTAISYTSMCRFIFRGTDNYGLPTNIKVISWVSKATQYGNIRLYDVTNSLVIATSANINTTSNTIVDLGVISNVPAADAVLEFQTISSSTSCTVYISAGHIYFF